MAEDKITSEELIEKDIFANPIESAIEFQKQLGVLTDMLDGFKKSASVLGKGIMSVNPKTIKDVETLTKDYEQLKNVGLGVAMAEKKIADIRKLNKDIVAATLSPYSALTLEYKQAAQAAKDLAAAEGLSSRAAQEAAAKAAVLNDRLKAIDASVGNYQRNVGNYHGELLKYGKGLKGLAGIVRTVGEFFGFNTVALEQGVHAAKEAAKLLKEYEHAQKAAKLATQGATVAKEAEIIVDEELAVAEGALTGGIGLLIAALGVAAIAIYNYVTEANEMHRIDEANIKTKKTLAENEENYNKRLEDTTRELIKQKVLKGTMSERDAAIANEELNRQDEILKRTKKLATDISSELSNRGIKASELINGKVPESVIGTKKKFLGEGEVQITQGELLSDIEIRRAKEANKAIAELKRQYAKEVEAITIEARIKAGNIIQEDINDEKKKDDDDIKKYKEKLKTQKEAFENYKKEIREMEEKFRQEDLKNKADEAAKERDDEENKNARQVKANLDKMETERKNREDAAKKRADEKREEQLRQVETAKIFAKAIEDGIEERINKEIDAEKRKLSQIDSNIKTQQDLAARGLRNTLAFEEREKAASLARQAELEKKKHREEEGEKLADIFLEFLKGYAKDGKEGGAQKALTQTLIAAGISKALAGNFAEGVENFQGQGTETSDSNIIGFSKGESVATAKGTRENKGAVTAMNEGKMDDWVKQNYAEQVLVVQDRSKSEQLNDTLVKMLMDKIDAQTSVIKNKKEVSFELNHNKEWVETIVENGIKRKITHKDSRWM